MDTALNESIDDIIFEDSNFKEGHVMCMICRKHFKMITATHLRGHDITMAEYVKKYPAALLHAPEIYKNKPSDILPIKPDLYIDDNGNKREIGTNKIITGRDALTKYNPKQFDKLQFKDYAKSYSEKLFIFLTSIVESKDKTITLTEKFKAADMIHKSLPKPATERVTESTVKKLIVNVGGKLPEGYKAGDF